MGPGSWKRAPGSEQDSSQKEQNTEAERATGHVLIEISSDEEKKGTTLQNQTHLGRAWSLQHGIGVINKLRESKGWPSIRLHLPVVTIHSIQPTSGYSSSAQKSDLEKATYQYA